MVVLLTLVGVAFCAVPAQGATYALGATALVEGPTAGSDSVILAASPRTATWTATTNAAWLHLSQANRGGAGNTNVVFSYDANPGATRTGTLTIAGLKLTITQAGSNYVAVSQPATTLVASGLLVPAGVAVGPGGSIFIADSGNDAIKKWAATNNAVTTVTTSGLYGRLSSPIGLGLDGAGNVYIADSGNNAIEKWTAASNTVTTLVSKGLMQPFGVAVASPTNVFIADTYNNALKEWIATGTTSTVITLVSNGLFNPDIVAMDIAAHVYIADYGDNAIKKWEQVGTNSTLTTVTTNVSLPRGVAVDGSGNIYIADIGDYTIKKWTAASNTVTTLVSNGLMQPFGVTVDASGSVYFTDTLSNTLEELPRAFVNPTAKLEGTNAGNDTLPVVLPTTENLNGPFAPASDQSWLTITRVSNGVVSFAFTSSGGTNRTGHITLLGQTISITQTSSTTPVTSALGATALVEGPTAGSDSVVLAVSPKTATWTATTNAAWLHLSQANRGGAGNTNVVFSYDANPGATRTGTLTIAGLTLAITQAGSTYVAASLPATTLAASGLHAPTGVAVDGAGNVYIADSENNAIRKWTASNNIVTTVTTNGLSSPAAVAVDGTGNVYIADSGNNAITMWTASNNTVSTLISNGLSRPFGVAADGAGNVFIADTLNSAIKQWSTAGNIVSTLFSNGLTHPFNVALDSAGNVYIADFGSNAVRKLSMGSNTVMTTVVSNGLSSPAGVAVDGAGNVYIADSGNNAIKKWTAASNTVTTLVSSGLSYPFNVAVDGAGNVYIADTLNNAIKEFPRAFVDPTAKLEGADAGSDTLAAVLPATENLIGPFAPTSDQPWLTISGITNGVVSFAFSSSAGTNRAANITLLGQTIPVTQIGLITPPTLAGVALLGNGRFQFAFSNNQGASFTVLSTTNLSLPLTDWTVAGTPTNVSPGLFQFTEPVSTNDSQRFYRVRSP